MSAFASRSFSVTSWISSSVESTREGIERDRLVDGLAGLQ
jgi:hypothetical protein